MGSPGGGFAARSRRADARDAQGAAPGAQLHQQSARDASSARGASRSKIMSKVVGIDLGTTNSLVAYVEDGVPVVIRDAGGDALVPSIVSIGDDGTIFVGREAQRRLLTAPSRTVYSVKRFMGRGIDDVRDEAGLLPFRLSGDPGGVVRIGVGGSRVHAARNLRVRAARTEASRRGALPRERGVRLRGRPRRDHGSRLLQRRAADGNARRGSARRSRRAPHHQRADRRVARLRPRQAESRHRSPSTTWAAAPSTSRS